MSNIRDLQKLRVYKNQSVFAQTNYQPQQIFNGKQTFYDNFPQKNVAMSTKSPTKFLRQTDQSNKTYNKSGFHRRGGSIGLNINIPQQKIFHNPRVSVYNISMKMPQFRSRANNNPQGSQTQRKQKDLFLQQNDTLFIRKRTNNVYSPQKNSPSTKNNSPLKSKQLINSVSKNLFNILYPIGKGGFGKVWKVQTKKTKTVYAMKQMSKIKIITKKSVSSVLNEKQFLSKLYHPFIVNIKYAFQDRQNLFLIMDYLDGGDLRYHLGNRKPFNQKQTKFIISNILIGLQYLHKNSIIHRDIKPQNLVFDSQGYIRITDLGISRQFRQNNSSDTSGTPGYMAPEVMCRKDHSFQVDYFALGVIAYQLMLGKRPYLGKDRKQIKQNIMTKQAQVRVDELPYKWSPHAIDFTNKLLLRNPQSRLGSNGIQQIMSHPWLKDIQWEKTYAKKIKPPFRPVSIQEDYESYKQQISQDTIVENQDQTQLLLRDPETRSLFEGYYYQRNDDFFDRKITNYSTTYTQERKR